MPSTRRSALRVLGGGLAVTLAGCLGSSQVHPEDHVADWHDEPVRGRGPPIDVERTVEPRRLENKCSWEAADAVEEAVVERGGRFQAVSVEHTKTSELPDAGWVVLVQRVLVYGPSGEVRQTPAVAFDTLLEVTPPTVGVTVSGGSEAYSCRYEVYVSDTYRQTD